MEEKAKFSVLVEFPNGMHRTFIIYALDQAGAIDLVYWAEGQHKFQPDRSCYWASEF